MSMKIIKEIWLRVVGGARGEQYPVNNSISKKWVGNDYGGFFVVTDNSIIKDKEPLVVFSFGIGEDISFEKELLTLYDAKIYCFDPTPKSVLFMKKQELTNKIIFIPVALGNFNGTAEFYLPKNENYVSGSCIRSRDLKSDSIRVPINTFTKIIEKIKVRKIDILKIDIEGTEYDVLDEILNANIFISQILVETHARLFSLIEARKKNKCFYGCLKQHGYKLVCRRWKSTEQTFVKTR